MLSKWTLSCTLPSINSTQALVLLGLGVQVEVVFNSSATSNAVTVGLYRSPGSLGVTSVSGCQSPDATGPGAQGCLSNDLLTIRGANFNATGIASLQSQTITLAIRATLGRATSNWLLGVGYSGSLNTSPSTASSPEWFRAAFIVCLVLRVALTVACMALLALLCCHGGSASTPSKLRWSG